MLSPPVAPEAQPVVLESQQGRVPLAAPSLGRLDAMRTFWAVVAEAVDAGLGTAPRF